MSQTQRLAAGPSGLHTALDVLVAPRAAFTAIRERPTWVWAFAISSVLGIIAALAIVPVTEHVIASELPGRLAADPQLAQLPADDRQARIAQIVGITQMTVRFSFAAIPFGLAIGSALQALVMLVASAAAKGDGTFKRFWALAVNASIVGTGASSVILMIIVLIRGADGFASTSAIPNALPGLGLLVPAGAKAASAFFSTMNVFAIWNVVLLVIGMTIVGRVTRPAAIGAAAVILIGTGVVPLIGALVQK